MSIVITGNPGVGKHTIAEIIANRLDMPIVDINKIAKDAGLFEENEHTNDVDTEKLADIIKHEMSDRKIIVGHLAPYILENAQIEQVIILRRDPYKLIPVYEQRKYSDKKIKENVTSEILGIIAHDAMERFGKKAFQIINDEKATTAEKIMALISDNEGGEQVDWLELVRGNNDLGKFFVD